MTRPTIRVQTASGRVYVIDLDGKRFRTDGDQPFGELVFGHIIDAPDPHHDWTDFASLRVDDMGRLYIVEERGGAWRQSTRVVAGLEDLVDALDGAA